MDRKDNPNRRFYSCPVKALPSYKAYTPREWRSIDLYGELTDLATNYLLLHFHPEFEFEFWGWVTGLRKGRPELVLLDEDHPAEEWLAGLRKLDKLSRASGTWWLFQGPHIAIGLKDWRFLYKRYLRQALSYSDLRHLYLKYGFGIDERPERWFGFPFSRWIRKDADSLD